jgi:hypothetical protein
MPKRIFRLYFLSFPFRQKRRHDYPRTARVIGGLDSSDIFCNSDYKHFLTYIFFTIREDYYTMVKSIGLSSIALKNQKILAFKVQYSHFGKLDDCRPA